ncbi:MAG: hypothetical protein M3N98_16275 [Actinomycetota bacterium]|nr:hypothetical protein [Actinomycetota bacterium]
MATTAAQTKVHALLATQSIAQLVEQYEMTDTLLAGANADEANLLFVTRGWIMDELDARGEAGDAAMLALCGIEAW